MGEKYLLSTVAGLLAQTVYALGRYDEVEPLGRTTEELAVEGDIAQLVSRIVGTGAGVIDVRRRTADLESIFRGEA